MNHVPGKEEEYMNNLIVLPKMSGILTTNLAAVVCVCAKFDQFLPARSYFESILFA